MPAEDKQPTDVECVLTAPATARSPVSLPLLRPLFPKTQRHGRVLT